MAEITDLIRLLDDPEDDDAYYSVFGEPEPLDIDEDLLPPEDDQPFLFKELLCNLLADHGPDALDAVPSLIRCTEDETDNLSARFMRLAAAEAIWKITDDPAIYIPVCERLLLDSECWMRRYVVDLLEEIAHPAALPALLARLGDPRVEVRDAANRAIEKITGGSS